MVCPTLTEAQKVILRRYDSNNDGYLSQTEAVQVTVDYFAGVSGITQEITNAATAVYNDHCFIGTSITLTCSSVISQYLSLLQRYDVNRSGKIEQSEGVQANVDYFANLITRAEADAIVFAYNNACTFTPATVTCTQLTGSFSIN
jgi:Ca2+-binding EF-hand superfamily protein